ncbi:MAG TPA: hypothetical protein VJC07_00950 [Candidatus Nanoarchaeia archaeon]|nr:hypothetical protein [Candidatus Nanoarchaeia archaeon]
MTGLTGVEVRFLKRLDHLLTCGRPAAKEELWELRGVMQRHPLLTKPIEIYASFMTLHLKHRKAIYYFEMLAGMDSPEDMNPETLMRYRDRLHGYARAITLAMTSRDPKKIPEGDKRRLEYAIDILEFLYAANNKPSYYSAMLSANFSLTHRDECAMISLEDAVNAGDPSYIFDDSLFLAVTMMLAVHEPPSPLDLKDRLDQMYHILRRLPKSGYSWHTRALVLEQIADGYNEIGLEDHAAGVLHEALPINPSGDQEGDRLMTESRLRLLAARNYLSMAMDLMKNSRYGNKRELARHFADQALELSRLSTGFLQPEESEELHKQRRDTWEFIMTLASTPRESEHCRRHMIFEASLAEMLEKKQKPNMLRAYRKAHLSPLKAMREKLEQ